MRLIEQIELPSIIKEGWGITHSYMKDYKNLYNLHEALDNDDNDDNLYFEKGIYKKRNTLSVMAQTRFLKVNLKLT